MIMKSIFLILAIIIASYPGKTVIAQAEINGGVNVTVNVPVHSWETYTGTIPTPYFFYSMDNFNEGTEYKIEVVADAPSLVQNIQIKLLMISGMSSSTLYLGSEDPFTMTENGGFAFTFDVPSTTPIGQTQLVKFRITRHIAGPIWDWQTTFFCYINTVCLDSYTFSTQTLVGRDYEASNYIDVSTAVNPNGGTTELDGGQSVSLLPGFSSNLSGGGEIVALIDGCGGAHRPGGITSLNSPGENIFEESNPVVISPNPSTGIFTITSNREAEVALEVLDMVGRSVHKTVLKNKASCQLDLSRHTKGIYLLRMNSEGKMQTQKMVLQ
jgi:hypothetical protein